ncbi:hypothetical protein C8R45DRAFT_1087535 [Mycena sanguinolenta]|nr:hypothetical protein C8R45DRAFT_1087535 [Mycena sanguinolenta]
MLVVAYHRQVPSELLHVLCRVLLVFISVFRSRFSSAASTAPFRPLHVKTYNVLLSALGSTALASVYASACSSDGHRARCRTSTGTSSLGAGLGSLRAFPAQLCRPPPSASSSALPPCIWFFLYYQLGMRAPVPTALSLNDFSTARLINPFLSPLSPNETFILSSIVRCVHTPTTHAPTTPWAVIHQRAFCNHAAHTSALLPLSRADMLTPAYSSIVL